MKNTRILLVSFVCSNKQIANSWRRDTCEFIVYKLLWFNPPYSANVKTNVRRKFLSMIRKHFSPTSPLYLYHQHKEDEGGQLLLPLHEVHHLLTQHQDDPAC